MGTSQRRITAMGRELGKLMTATFETDNGCKFIFFTYDGKEWLRFVGFYGHEETVTLGTALKIFRAEKRKRAEQAPATKEKG